MATTLVNLTLLKVIGEMEDILTIYPDQIYKQILNDQDLQQRLIAYVLNRIPNKYITVDDERVPSILSESMSCSSLEKIEIEEAIKKGIYHLVNSEKHYDLFYSLSN